MGINFFEQYVGKVAIIHDWLVVRGGAERVLENILTFFPGAPIFTHVYNPQVFAGSLISKHKVHTSLITRLPAAHEFYRSYLPLMPFAVEQFDLREFQIVLSVSFATAHGVLTRPDQLHLSYICSPARYAWHLYQDYLDTANLHKGLKARLVRLVLHYLRLWDVTASIRVDQYLAVSEWVSNCIKRAFGRESAILYPPVQLERFNPELPREDYFMTVSRLVPYKKIDLIIKAFNQSGLPLLIVGTGPEKRKLKKIAGPNIEILGYLADDQVANLLNSARGYVYMAEEDFGISMVEAQAAGCPVIAFRNGGAREIINDGQHGILFDQQTPDSLNQAIHKMIKLGSFDSAKLRENAMRFSAERFKNKFMQVLMAHQTSKLSKSL